MASVEGGDVADIDALLRAAEILEEKLYSKSGYGTAGPIRKINVSQFIEWLSTRDQTNDSISVDPNVSSTVHVELANFMQTSGCQKIGDLQSVYGSAHKSSPANPKSNLSYSDDDPVYTYHPDNWKHCAVSLLRPDSVSKMPLSHCRILTAATGVSQLSESFSGGGIGTTDEPDGLSNTSDDVCMDSSSQDSYSGNVASVRSNTDVAHILNSSLGSECIGNIDAEYSKSQYSNCRLRSALLTPYSPGSEIRLNDNIKHSNHFLNKGHSVSNLPLQNRPVAESIAPEVFPNNASSQRLLEVLSRTCDLVQRNPKFRTCESPQNIPNTHQQTSWSAPPSVSSSSCGTPDKEFLDVPSQSEITQPTYPIRPTRFSCSSLPVKKRKLDWKLSDNFSSDLQSPDKHLCKLKKTNANSSDLVVTSDCMATLNKDIFTYCSSSGTITERRQSVGSLFVSETTQRPVTSKTTTALLRTCSVPINNEQHIIHSSDPSIFSKHLIEKDKTTKSHYQNHYSVLTRTLTGSHNTTNNNNCPKQYPSDLTTMPNGSKMPKDGVFNNYSVDDKMVISFSNTDSRAKADNYFPDVSNNNNNEDLYVSEVSHSTPSTIHYNAKKPATTDSLFRSPHNALKSRHTHNNNNQISSSSFVDTNSHNNNNNNNNNNNMKPYHAEDICKQNYFSKLQTARTVEMNTLNLSHSNDNKSNGSPVGRKYNGLIQTISYNDHNNTMSQLSHTPQDTVYALNSVCRKQCNDADDFSITIQDQNKNNYTNDHRHLSITISTTTASTPTAIGSLNVDSYNLNTSVQSDNKNECKLVSANPSPTNKYIIPETKINKFPTEQLKSLTSEYSYQNLPSTTLSSSRLTNPMNVNGAHVIMMLSPSPTIPTSLHSLNDQVTSSPSLSNTRQNLCSTSIPHPFNFSQTSHTIATTNSWSSIFNRSSNTSFPLLLVSASSSASAAALAKAAALATGVPSTSFVPVPVQVTTYVPPLPKTSTKQSIANDDDKLKCHHKTSDPVDDEFNATANTTSSNQHFILSVIMNDDDCGNNNINNNNSVLLNTRKIPFVLSASIFPSNLNDIHKKDQNIIDNKHPSTVLKDISLITSGSDDRGPNKLTHQIA